MNKLPSGVQMDDGSYRTTIPTVSPGGVFTSVASFTRPANTTAYAAGKRVADSTTAATVLEFDNIVSEAGDALTIGRLRMRKSGPSFALAQFRAHFFRVLPVVSVNDGGVFDTSGALAVADITGYIGSIDVTMTVGGTVGAAGAGAPTTGTQIITDLSGTTLWVVVEALAAYVPLSAEIFTLTIEASK